MGLEDIWDKNKEAISGFAGAGSGLVAGELSSEWIVRVTGQTGYPKAGVKTVVKGIIGIVAFMTGVAAGGAWSTCWKAFAFSNWGSTVLDWIFAVYPGGVFGIAERMAVTVRTWAMGAKRVSAQLSALDRARVSRERFDGTTGLEVAAKRPSAGVVTKYR